MTARFRSRLREESTNDPANPLSKQGINLRCYYNKQNLFDIERYVKGYPGLKPGREDTVMYAVIAGVPQELVSAEAREGVNFEDQAERDAYYDRILTDTRMLERPMNENVPAIANVAPSCTRTDRFGERADAFPPRRMVELAKAIGANATVQSICQDDFGPAIDGLIALTKRRTQQKCLPEELKRASDGKIKCDVLWQLPLNFSEPAALSNCADIPFLSEVSSPRAKHTDSGRLCKVAQLAVTSQGIIPSGSGWFYDDFSDEREGICKAGSVARIAFSEDARPQAGVKAYLDCAN